jgi:hypothetical protein
VPAISCGCGGRGTETRSPCDRSDAVRPRRLIDSPERTAARGSGT